MIKKISAIVLALVLCLSVVVMPASAYSLGASSEVAYVIELDKDKYEAGESVTVNLYLYGKSGLEFGTGAIVIGMNSALFDMAENVIDDVKGGSTCSDLMASYYKSSESLSWAWQTNATVLTNISNGNTADENAMFDQYIKFTLARNTAGTHDNAGSNKNGLPTDEINADSEAGVAFVSFSLKLKDEIEDGTEINFGIPTGSMPKNYTYMNYYKTPGTATTVVKTTAATSEIVNSTSAQIGAAFEFPVFTIADGSNAIRFEKNADKSYANKVSVRTMAKIPAADLQAATGATSNDDIEAKIVKVGFVYAPTTTTFNAADAQTVARGGSVAGYKYAEVSYIQNAGTTYNFSCLVEVQDADIAAADFNVYAFIELDFGANGTQYYFSAAKDAISSKALYNAHNDAAWAKYGWGTATDK